jgi:hypothetical protein
MGHPPPVGRRGEIGEAGHLLLGEHVPQPEIDTQTAVGLHLHAALYQGLGVDQAPIREPWPLAQARGVLDEGALVDRPEQTGALEVGRYDPGQVLAGLRFLEGLGVEVRDGNRQGLDEAPGDVDVELGARRRAGPQGHGQRQGHGRYEGSRAVVHVPLIPFRFDCLAPRPAISPKLPCTLPSKPLKVIRRTSPSD